MRRWFLAWPRLGLVVPVAAAVLLGAGGPASAGTAGASAGDRGPAGPVMPVRSCASLAQMNFTGVPDAPGKVTSSAVVSDTLRAGPVRPAAPAGAAWKPCPLPEGAAQAMSCMHPLQGSGAAARQGEQLDPGPTKGPSRAGRLRLS